LLGAVALAASMRTAQAGPPYVTDDPEPTDTGHFENYLFVEGTRAAGSYSYPAVGVEVNYGAFANTQLTWSLPLNVNPGPLGVGVVWAPLGGGVKYRFIQEDEHGWRPQAALFPQVYIPIGAASRTSPITEVLPLWIQKTIGKWVTFGGGGYTRNPGVDNRNYAIYGWGLQREVSENLSLGAEIFGQTHDTVDDHGSTAAGFAALYDIDETWHLIGSINSSIAGAGESDRFSYNLALKWTR
jgi:hypothetical protein